MNKAKAAAPWRQAKGAAAKLFSRTGRPDSWALLADPFGRPHLLNRDAKGSEDGQEIPQEVCSRQGWGTKGGQNIIAQIRQVFPQTGQADRPLLLADP
jgi:hypothetical protein